MLIIDSGVHVWLPEGPDRPWMPGRTAHLPEPLTYQKFAAMMDDAGVSASILVPPSWEGERIDYSLEAAQKYPNRFAVMGRFPINQPEERERLETWRDQKGMLGVRLTLHHEWDRTWMRDGTADWFWPAAERLGIPVMLNAPYTHKEIGEVAARHPRLRIILDHLGARTTQKDDALRPQVVSTGTAFAIVVLRSVEALGRLAVRQQEATEWLRERGARWFYVMARTGEEAPAWRARMQFNGGEDPATGSAAGCAISYLVKHGAVAADERIHVRQGVEMGRPSDIFLSAKIVLSKVSDVHVAGSTVVVANGRLFLP